MPSVGQSYHVYLDLDVLNSDFDSGAQSYRLEFQETRNSPFLDGDASNYFCSIVRFSIQTGNSLPCFIPRIANPVADRDETIYKVTLAYGSKETTVAVRYNPGDNINSLLTSGVDINTSLGGNYIKISPKWSIKPSRPLSPTCPLNSPQIHLRPPQHLFGIWILTPINSCCTPK